MKKFVVTGQVVRIHSGILRLTPEQAQKRMYGIPERMKRLHGDYYEVLRPVSFTRGESFYHKGAPLGRDVQELPGDGLLDKAKQFLQGEPENETPAPTGGLLPAGMTAPPDLTGEVPAAEPLDAKSLFARLGLSFMAGKSLLKKDYGLEVQNNQTVVPASIVQQVLAAHDSAV